MTVAFITFCHPPRYVEKLHRPGVLAGIIQSHQYKFDEIVVIHQRCRSNDYPPFDIPARPVDLPESEFDDLLRRFRVNPHNPRADELSHGPTGAHFWRHHLVNHLRGAEVTHSDYIVFADCDTYMKSQPEDEPGWIDVGISILETYPDVLIVGPGDGGDGGGGMGEGGRLPDAIGARRTQNVSQQLFICRGEQFRYEVNFDVPWDGKFDAPGGPMQEFYIMLEGRLFLYMRESGTWRAVLPDRWRYWHDGQWGHT